MCFFLMYKELLPLMHQSESKNFLSDRVDVSES